MKRKRFTEEQIISDCIPSRLRFSRATLDAPCSPSEHFAQNPPRNYLITNDTHPTLRAALSVNLPESELAFSLYIRYHAICI